jgi:hypothetical protein
MAAAKPKTKKAERTGKQSARVLRKTAAVRRDGVSGSDLQAATPPHGRSKVYIDRVRVFVPWSYQIKRSSAPSPVHVRLANIAYQKALRFYRDGALNSAIKMMKFTRKLYPEFRDSKTVIRYWLQERDGILENEKILRNRVEAHPSDVESKFDLGHTYLVLGAKDEAVRMWKAVSEADLGYWGKQAKKMLQKHDRK